MIDPQPPKWAKKIFKWYCDEKQYEYIAGDLDELFFDTLSKKGQRRANYMYVIQVAKLFRTSILSNKKPISTIMFSKNLKLAVRNMSRHASLSILNILGLSLSITISLLAITILEDQYSYDEFHDNKNRIYRLETLNGGQDNFATSPLALGEEMRTNFPGVEEVASFELSGSRKIRHNKNDLDAKGLNVTDAFFRVFSFPFVLGNETAIDDHSAILITESLATRLFGRTDVMGKTLTMDDSTALIVGGILEDVPQNSHFDFDFVTLFDRTEKLARLGDRSWQMYSSSYNYVLFENEDLGTSPQASLDRITASHYDEGKRKYFKLRQLRAIYPGDNVYNPPYKGPMNPMLLKVLAGVSLLMIIFATFNYASLVTARALTRAKEIGVRKAFGAHRRHIVFQVLVESTFIALLSCFFGILLLHLIIPSVYGLNPGIRDFFRLTPHLSTYFYFFVFSALVGFFAGIIPAFYFSRFNTIQALRNYEGLKFFSKRGLRMTLILFQLVVGAVCISTAILTQKQFRYEMSYDRGFATQQVVNIRTHGRDFEVFKNLIDLDSRVEKTSLSSNVPGSSANSTVQAEQVENGKKEVIGFIKTDQAFLDTYQIETIVGGLFNQPFDKRNGVILNKKAVAQLGLGDPNEAIGKQILAFNKSYFVSGIIEDFNMNDINGAINPLMILRTDFSNEGNAYLTVRFNQEITQDEVDFLRDSWFGSGHTNELDYSLSSERLEQSSASATMSKIMGFFGFQMFVIALLGISGISKWMAEIRAREMSIRQILGAGQFHLLLKLSRGFAITLIISLLIALPVSYLANSAIWLNHLVNRVDFNWQVVLGSILILVIPALTLMLAPSIYVLRKKPTDFLRSE